MKIQMNFAKLLKLNPDRPLETNRRIREMVSERELMDAGVTETELRDLVYNRARRVRITTLAALVQYAIRKRFVTKADVRVLLGGLFEIAPETMWSLLAERRHVELWKGARRPKEGGDYVVIATDPILEAVVLNRLTEERGGDPRYQTHDARGSPGVASRLILTWEKDGRDEIGIQQEAFKFYKANFEDLGDDVGLVQIGSVKSLPTTEFTFAHTFHHAEAFVSEDGVAYPQDRSCPLHIIYRPEDVQPPSCHAGTRLSRNDTGDGPGIYYETNQIDIATGRRKWVRLPWGERSDCAMVFYRYIKSPARVEMVLGGYSGRGTRCLAEYLEQRGAGEFWPPTFSDGELEIGMFFLRFTFDDPMDAIRSGGLTFPKPSRTEKIAMDAEVIERRVRRHRTSPEDKNDNSNKGNVGGQDQ